MSLVNITNNVNINTKVLQQHESQFPESFVKCVQLGATWLAVHSNISYQTSVMVRTDAMLYNKSGSELIRVGLIDVDKPLTGLTFYDVLSIVETKDEPTNNTIYEVKLKYKTPLGITVLLIPITYFNPAEQHIDKEPTVEQEQQVTTPKQEEKVPVTNDNGSTNENTQPQYFPPTSSDELPEPSFVTKQLFDSVVQQLREQIYKYHPDNQPGATPSAPLTVDDAVMQELAKTQETIVRFMEDTEAKIDIKLNVDDFNLFQQEALLRLQQLEQSETATKLKVEAAKADTLALTEEVKQLENRIPVTDTFATAVDLQNYVTKEAFEAYKNSNTQPTPDANTTPVAPDAGQTQPDTTQPTAKDPATDVQP